MERNQVTDAFTILRMNNNITHHYYGHFHRTETLEMYGIKHRLLKMNAGQKQNEKTFVKMFQNGKYVLWKC